MRARAKEKTMLNCFNLGTISTLIRFKFVSPSFQCVLNFNCAMGATQRARLTVSDFDFQIKGQTARLYSTETHFGGGGSTLATCQNLLAPRTFRIMPLPRKENLFATTALKFSLTYLICNANYLHQHLLVRSKNKPLRS